MVTGQSNMDRWGVAAAEEAIARGIHGRNGTTGDPETILRMFPEYELVVEPEEEYQGDEEVKKAMAGYEEMVSTEGELEDLGQEDLKFAEEMATAERIHFASFQAKIAAAPSQVLRYCFEDGAQPLWPAREPKGPQPDEIPPCSACGASRKFEFQIMPQIIHHLGQDPEDPESLDFSTIAIYTCSQSCTTSTEGEQHHPYVEEFAWVQASV